MKDNGTMTKNMDSDIIIMLMVIIMKVHLLKVKSKVSVLRISKTATVIVESIKATSFMEKGNIGGKMDPAIKVSLIKEKEMDMGFGDHRNFKIVKSMKEITWMIKRMDLGFINGLMGHIMMGISRMIENMVLGR